MNYSTFLSASAALLTAACASTPLVVPDALRPATNESLVTTVGARGVQVYECRARKDGGGHEWAFVAPDADLLDAQGKAIGRHGAGPYWQSADGSRVVGTVRARADAPASGSIPWLLLTTKSSGPVGAFSNVTSIQRVNTAGGVAPATPCTAQLTGTPARVPYTADYRLFTAR
ncbi:MAG: hypothetical protein H6R02_178 [Burkholderiaceae bacterium]|jgi:hypothetical protein|nr:hypothetical protein [Burkholderiaceae bacterium]